MMKQNKKEQDKKIKMKRPKFIIFTDKDGTLNLEDKEISNIFKLITSMKGMVIPVTGRSVKDFEEELRKRGITVPELIAGDNGGTVYSTSKKQFLIKKDLEHDKAMGMINHYLKNGGDINLVRFTDGTRTYVSSAKEVKTYYKNKKEIVFCDDIYQKMQQTKEITKITLAGSNKIMTKNAEFAKDLNLWTDSGSTKFPKASDGNIRTDISQNGINKGEIVKLLVGELKPEYGYMCVGDGNNDLPMFKQALEDGQYACVVGSAKKELKAKVKEMAKGKKGKMIEIPRNNDLANKFILKMSKVFQSYVKKEERKRQIQKKRNRRLENVERIDVKTPKQSELIRRSHKKRSGLEK